MEEAIVREIKVKVVILLFDLTDLPEIHTREKGEKWNFLQGRGGEGPKGKQHFEKGGQCMKRTRRMRMRRKRRRRSKAVGPISSSFSAR